MADEKKIIDVTKVKASFFSDDTPTVTSDEVNSSTPKVTATAIVNADGSVTITIPVIPEDCVGVSKSGGKPMARIALDDLTLRVQLNDGRTVTRRGTVPWGAFSLMLKKFA